LVSRINIGTTTSGSIAAARRDTVIIEKGGVEVKATKFEYSDRWLRLRGVNMPDSTHIQYSVDNIQKTTWKYERENKLKFWRAKHLVFEIESENPSTTVNKVQTIVVQPERKKFYETQWFSGLVGVAAGFYLRGR
jgi:hypothetical protein